MEKFGNKYFKGLVILISFNCNRAELKVLVEKIRPSPLNYNYLTLNRGLLFVANNANVFI